MTLDEIISDLRSARDSGPLPEAALRAAVSKSDELAPHIYALTGKAAKGVFLLPGDRNLLFYGLYVLAAARHPDLYPQIVALARLPQSEFEEAGSYGLLPSLPRFILTSWDGDVDALLALIEHADLNTLARSAFYRALTMLTARGPIPRERTLAFLERIERDGLLGDDDPAWSDWEDAIVRLGFVELEPALARVLEREVNEERDAEERGEVLAALRRAAAVQDKPGIYDEVDIRPIDDPVEALSWIEETGKLFAELATSFRSGLPEAFLDDEEDDGIDDDPAKDIRLTDEEEGWLAGFLASRQAPPESMPLEMLDGYLTALVIGPDLVLPSEYMPMIWDPSGAASPEWDSLEQFKYFMELLTKHWNAIAARRSADSSHVPLIDTFLEDSEGVEGALWAVGFVRGLDLRKHHWDAMARDQEASKLMLPILSLSPEITEELGEILDIDDRDEILEAIPEILREIAAYWRKASRKGGTRFRSGQSMRELARLPRPPNESLRVQKVGRNEPCPCGSGKKFKKCCGSSTPGTLH